MQRLQNDIQAGNVQRADISSSQTATGADKKPAQNNNVDNQAVGNTTIGALEKTMTNEVGSLSTPKKGDPDVLADAKDCAGEYPHQQRKLR